jgi:hypothetical protein
MDDTTDPPNGRHPVAVQLEQTRSQLGELAELPMFGIPDQQLPELVCVARAAASQAQAVYLNLLAQADACEIARKGKRAASTQAWMRNTLHIRPGTAKRERLLAAALRRRPRLATAVAAGHVNPEQAEAIIDALAELPSDCGDACRDDAETILLNETDRLDTLGLIRVGLRIRDRVDPARAEAEEAARLARQERDAHDRRYLRMRDDGHGCTHGTFRLASVEAAALRAVLDVLAKPQPASETGRDPRTAEQRMADALIQTARLTQRTGDLPANGGDRPVVVVTIAYPWLLDQLRGHALLRDTDTPISPAAARRLACDANILPMVLGGDSQPLDVGRAQRFFTKAQRHAIATRDRHCVHPGCDRPATWCDYHHVKHWADGGTTDVANGVLLCTYHHALYDRNEWLFICGPHGPTHVVPPTFIDLEQTPIPINRE